MMPPQDRPEPDFMPRLRRLFADGLPERVERMRRGLDGVAADMAAGRPPSPTDLEEIFLASHSLKGTAPGFGAHDLGCDAAELSETAREWSVDAPPPAGEVARARRILARIARECEAVVARIDAASGAEPVGS